MKTLLLLIVFIIVFLGFSLRPAHADYTDGISIRNINVQPSVLKVGNTFFITATLVNNSTVPIAVDGGTCLPKMHPLIPFFTVTLDDHAKIKTQNLNCAGVGLGKILNHGENLIGTSPDSTFSYIATKSGIASVIVTFSYHGINQTDPTQVYAEQTISKSFQFTIYDDNTKSTIPTYGVGGPVITITLDPLEQFKSGIPAKSITCQKDFVLIIKSEDDSPACVKSDTAMTLVKRGWAVESLKNFGYNPGSGPVSPEPKDSGQFSSIESNPFPPSTLNRLVFFIKSNSIAQIHVQYTSEFENTGNVDTGGQFYSGNPHDFIPMNSSQITISSSPDHVSMSYGTNTTVVYTISTKNVTSGLYWIFLTQICGVMPVAIDMNSSQITPSDIPVYSQHCPAQFLNAKILGISGGTAEYMQSQELR